MKTILLHLPSVAIGGGVALLLTLTLGFAQTTRPTPPAAQGPSPQLVGGMQGRPPARDLVFINYGDPVFTVPSGRILVITAVGEKNTLARRNTNTIPRFSELSINGAIELLMIVESAMSLSLNWPQPEGTSIEFPVGENNAGTEPFLAGYLEDA